MAVQRDPVNRSTDRERPSPLQLAPLFAAYLAFGVYWGVWVVVFAEFLRFHRIGEGAIGWRLAALSVASIATMLFLSPPLQRLPLVRTIPLALTIMGAGALLVARSSAVWLPLGFLVVGVGNGLIDVFVNVGGQGIEARTGRPVLQSLHASYNVGGVVGAIAAGLALISGVPFQVQLAVVAAVLVLAAGLNAWSPLVRGLPRPERSDTRVSVAVLARTPFLIVPALVVLSAFFVEGSMDIWSVIYVRRTLGATAMVGAVAFAAFSLAMALGRLTAARLLFGLGYRATVRISGMGSFVSGLVAAITGSPVVAGIAFLFLGFFIASAAPAAFGMIGETDEDPALAIAAMTTVGYTGFVIGPPIMGWVAETAGLRATMLLLVSATIGVFLGGVVRPHRREG